MSNSSDEDSRSDGLSWNKTLEEMGISYEEFRRRMKSPPKSSDSGLSEVSQETKGPDTDDEDVLLLEDINNLDSNNSEDLCVGEVGSSEGELAVPERTEEPVQENGSDGISAPESSEGSSGSGDGSPGGDVGIPGISNGEGISVREDGVSGVSVREDGSPGSSKADGVSGNSNGDDISGRVEGTVVADSGRDENLFGNVFDQDMWDGLPELSSGQEKKTEEEKTEEQQQNDNAMDVDNDDDWDESRMPEGFIEVAIVPPSVEMPMCSKNAQSNVVARRGCAVKFQQVQRVMRRRPYKFFGPGSGGSNRSCNQCKPCSSHGGWVSKKKKNPLQKCRLCIRFGIETDLRHHRDECIIRKLCKNPVTGQLLCYNCRGPHKISECPNLRSGQK